MKKKLTIFVLIALMSLLFIGQGPLYNNVKVKGYKALKVINYYSSVKPYDKESLYETDHFIIDGRGVEDSMTEDFGTRLEKIYYMAGKEFDYYPSKKTPVIIYGSLDDFWEQNKSLEGQTVMGLYYMGVIHLIAPGVFNMEMEEYEKNGPLLHEYVHNIVDEITGGNIEIWFTEGLALYQEYLNYGVRWGEDLVIEKEYTMEELRNCFSFLDPVQAYKESYIIVESMYEEGKRDKVLELLKELGKGKNMEDGFSNIYKKTLDKMKMDIRANS